MPTHRFGIPAPQDLRTGAWQPDGEGWLAVWEIASPALLALLLIALITRALLRRYRYRAVAVLTDADQAAVHAALREAEARTIGEIVPVVVERSDPHPTARWRASLALLLLGSALLEPYLPWGQPILLLLCQIALGAVGYGLVAAFRDVQRWFVTGPRATAVVEEQAVQEFHRLDLKDTDGRTGVLLFVSLLEHRVVVLADEGIDQQVDSATWAATRDAILAGVRRGSLRDGLIAGIATAGEVLARHAPWVEGNRNELPDRLVVRAE